MAVVSAPREPQGAEPFLTARWENLVLLNYECPPALLEPLVPAGTELDTEHYWGYTRQRNGDTLEYQVEHPPWQVWKATNSWFHGPAATLSKAPRSAFVAVGSPVAVHHGRRLR